MAPDLPLPLGVEEMELLEEGRVLFDSAQFWHAHESWESLWNKLKARQAEPREVLLVQGLIQTAALLLHHQRRNAIGVEKQWAKLQPKLEGWGVAWGIDVEAHLRSVQAYAEDRDTWSLRAEDHHLPQA